MFSCPSSPSKDFLLLEPLDPLEDVDEVEFGRAFDAEDGTMSKDSVIERIIPSNTGKVKRINDYDMDLYVDQSTNI